MKIVFFYAIFSGLLNYSRSSTGDKSRYYLHCLQTCTVRNCTKDGFNFTNDFEQPIYLSLLQWSCKDECKYQCMWETVKKFQEEKLNVPQFYGKWPFIRIFGIQEPASALFSLLNFYAHFHMIRIFRKSVSSDSSLYWLWHIYCLVCLNTWVWSTVFHIRDFPLTEFLDYVSAFSMVLMTCCCMIIRILRNKVSNLVLMVITCMYLSFFTNHVAYLNQDKFDYSYNMMVNIYIGTFTGICWITWCMLHRQTQLYVWKCELFVILIGLATALEIMDMPPLFYVFDCHSIYHLATAPIITLFYSFAIDDCNFLRTQQMEKEKWGKKNP